MIDSLSMVGHVLEAAAIAPEAIDCIALFLENEFVVVTHGVETGHDMGDLLYLGGEDGLHDPQLEVRVQVVTLVANLVGFVIRPIYCTKDHDPISLL